MTNKPTVLFLCQHNAGRSQLGAGLLEVLAATATPPPPPASPPPTP